MTSGPHRAGSPRAAGRGASLDASSLELHDTDQGCRLLLRVMAGARQDMVVGPHDGRLKMTVTAPPEKGRANQAVERLLATILNVGTSRVHIISGETSRDKTVLVEGCGAAELRRRLERMPRIATGPG